MSSNSIVHGLDFPILFIDVRTSHKKKKVN